jgi:hypothetical protein
MTNSISLQISKNYVYTRTSKYSNFAVNKYIGILFYKISRCKEWGEARDRITTSTESRSSGINCE